MPSPTRPDWLAALHNSAPLAFKRMTPTKEHLAAYVSAHVSALLAVAIGWDGEEDVRIELPIYWSPITRCDVWFQDKWRAFDYTDPLIVQAVCDRYLVKVKVEIRGLGPRLLFTATYNDSVAHADSLELAVALALIEATGANERWNSPEKSCG